MRTLLFILFFLTITFDCFATEQEPDLLVFGNDTIYLKSYPLEFLKLTERPFGHSEQTPPSTACWRGYSAIWRIKDNQLFLEKVIQCQSDINNKGDEDIVALFNRNQIEFLREDYDGMILANWVTIDLYSTDNPYARNFPDRIYLQDVYLGNAKNEEKSLKIRIINGTIEINKLIE